MFQGAPTTFDEMHEHILMIAAAFEAHGVKKGDTVTLCMPNIPQAIETLYALNRIGVTVSLIHPLSAEKEIVHYLTLSESKAVLVPDLFYDKVLAATEEIDRPIDIIVARMQDYLKFPLNAGYWATQGRKFTKFPLKGKGTAWKDYMKAGKGKCTRSLTQPLIAPDTEPGNREFPQINTMLHISKAVHKRKYFL